MSSNILISLLRQLLDIPSPTYKEREIINFIYSWLANNLSNFSIKKFKNNLIVKSQFHSGKKHLSFIGHCDVVPEFFPSYEKKGLVYGAGASDMLGGLACFLSLLKNEKNLLKNYNISLVIYSCEENTLLEENGLYKLIGKYPNFFKTIDLAIIGEPTDNKIHLGCTGSLHYTIKVLGEACHSARPWQGSNALYNALPLIKKLANIERKKVSIKGLDFFDVIQITESFSEKGKTTLPSFWQANVNYRFAPNKSEDDAKKFLESILSEIKINNLKFYCESSAPAGKIISSVFSDLIIKKLAIPIEAKQAWTDLAQLSSLGIPCFNFGPGFTSQAHKIKEFISIQYLISYYELLKRVFCN